MKRIVIIILVYFTSLFITLNAQEDISSKFAIEINTDNDAFIIWENFDRFYTYGAGLKLYFKPKKLIGLETLFKKKVNYFFSAGFRTEGYTPTREVVSALEVEEGTVNFERPFAGLLFGTFDATYLFKDSFIKAELYLGVMGPSALTNEIQDWIHDNITDDDLIVGWEFQIPDQLILNLNISGAYDLLPNSKWVDVYAQGEARIGNLYIDASPAIGFRFGKFSPLINSVALGNAFNAKYSSHEYFIRSTFSATVVAFDATAQGNIFNNDYEFRVENLSHFYTTMTHGVFMSAKRYALGFDHIFTFGKVNQKVRHIYGRVNFLYRF